MDGRKDRQTDGQLTVAIPCNAHSAWRGKKIKNKVTATKTDQGQNDEMTQEFRSQ